MENGSAFVLVPRYRADCEQDLGGEDLDGEPPLETPGACDTPTLNT